MSFESVEIIEVLPYVGIALLAAVLIAFEIRDRGGGNASARARGLGYEYYTPTGAAVRIRRIFGSSYRIYVSDPENCPVPTGRDRYGDYFPLRGRSAADIEMKIDDIYNGNG